MFNFFSPKGRRGRNVKTQYQGRGLRRGIKPGSGPSGACICLNCGHKIQHLVGERCMDIPCPKCNSKMFRE
jgi:hypothetical protein